MILLIISKKHLSLLTSLPFLLFSKLQAYKNSMNLALKCYLEKRFSKMKNSRYYYLIHVKYFLHFFHNSALRCTPFGVLKKMLKPGPFDGQISFRIGVDLAHINAMLGKKNSYHKNRRFLGYVRAKYETLEII